MLNHVHSDLDANFEGTVLQKKCAAFKIIILKPELDSLSLTKEWNGREE